jgi:hypothetical protein
MYPDSSADGRERKAFFPTPQALINTTPIARGEEAAHTYATLSPPLSPDISLGQEVPRIVNNIQAASYRGERPDDSSFTLFPKLPPEIRLNIWRHALLVPRIVEIDFNENWFYRSRTLPPLLSCNHESRIECLKAYSTCNHVIPQWIRFDWDTLYLKQLDFSTHYSFVKPELEYFSIQRWEPQEGVEISDESDKWIGRPGHFEKVHALAVNREVLTQTNDDYECIIRHFFPHLELLIVLIDDGVPIHEAWDVKEDDFKAYESDWGDYPPRWEFTRASTGPFTPVSDVNVDYENYVKSRMMERFEAEGRDYKKYKAPFISVRGCWLPPGVKVRECGRWPDDWDGWVRAIQ